MECEICYDNVATLVFWPCGHKLCRSAECNSGFREGMDCYKRCGPIQAKLEVMGQGGLLCVGCRRLKTGVAFKCGHRVKCLHPECEKSLAQLNVCSCGQKIDEIFRVYGEE